MVTGGGGAGEMSRSRELVPDRTPTVSVIATATAPHLAREIDDADLLSLAAPNPVVLVRLGPDSAELVFAHTPGQDAAEHSSEPQ